jgi:hypothetical protein
MKLKHLSKWTGAALVVAAATAGRASEIGSREWKEQWKTGIVCEDLRVYKNDGYVGCDDGIEKAMKVAAAQLPPLPKGVVIQATIEGKSDDAKDPLDYMLTVGVTDQTGARGHSVGYAQVLHCTRTHEAECGRSIIYRGYLTWEMGDSVAEGMNEKR